MWKLARSQSILGGGWQQAHGNSQIPRETFRQGGTQSNPLGGVGRQQMSTIKNQKEQETHRLEMSSRKAYNSPKRISLAGTTMRPRTLEILNNLRDYRCNNRGRREAKGWNNIRETALRSSSHEDIKAWNINKWKSILKKKSPLMLNFRGRMKLQIKYN